MTGCRAGVEKSGEASSTQPETQNQPHSLPTGTRLHQPLHPLPVPFHLLPNRTPPPPSIDLSDPTCGRMSPTQRKDRSSTHGDDPLTAVLQAANADESQTERQLRLAREAEERKVSDKIDAELDAEQKEKKRKAKSGKSELDILLLGPSGAVSYRIGDQIRSPRPATTKLGPGHLVDRVRADK